jgi:glycosyltransferase involved in cell wall biosynthesis
MTKLSTRNQAILLLIPHLVKGGAERQFSLLAQGLAAEGWDVHVAFSHLIGSDNSSWQHQNIHLYHLEGASTKDPRIVMALFAVVRNVRPILIHTWLRQMDLIGGLVSLLFAVPWIISERSSQKNYSHWRDKARRMLGSLGTFVVSNSNSGSQYWRTSGPTPPIRIINNGLSVKAYMDSAIVRENNDRPLVVSIGRLVASKRPVELIRALAPGLRSKRFCLVLIGDGPQADAVYEARALHNVVDDVLIIGQVTEGEVLNWLLRAEIFCSMSEFEGQPNTVMEAMAASCSLVISDILEHRSLVNSDEAIFANLENVGASIDSVLADPVGAAVRAERAYSRIQKFSLDNMVSAYSRLYSQIGKLYLKG